MRRSTAIATAMYARQPASLLARSVHIHPTVAEFDPDGFPEPTSSGLPKLDSSQQPPNLRLICKNTVGSS